MTNLYDIATAIRRSESILICGHIMPDGDCLGSVLALGLSLEAMGKKVVMAGPDPIPAIYEFLPGVERFKTGAPPDGVYDTFIILDCSVPERLGRDYQELLTTKKVVINIDHHAGPGILGPYCYIDTAAAAVGEIVFDLLKLMQVRISVETAINLYTAIVTDTGSFRYDSVTPGTHRRIAELLESGAPGAQINILLHEEKPKAALVLLREALHTLTVAPCGKVCWMTVTLEMLKNTGALDEHTEGLVTYCRSIRGVEVGLLFREILEDTYKVSLRSKNIVDVNTLAVQFGGGGHPKAAGCILKGALREIQDKVTRAAVLAAGGTA
ncbi:MAG TPA: bifunctional oligoribonuclease/PAP phosphatase NrnA [Pelotomaculum sp.]|nr:bifunctional oligoribonuclease/PAP phosphatase NrnA [Pelotomaculum sp.]